MTLDPLVSHPSSRSYVLKLHRDARPQDGVLFGRLECMSSGRSFAFASGAELLRCLSLDGTGAAVDGPTRPGRTKGTP